MLQESVRKRQPTDYFIPGDLALLVTHQDDFDAPAVLKRVQSHALMRRNAAADDVGMRWDEARAVTFPSRRPQPGFSLVFLPTTLGDPKASRAKERLIHMVDTLDDALGSEGAPDDDIVISAISPNWTAPAAQGHLVTGGPGARPTAASIPPSTLLRGMSADDPFRFSFDHQSETLRLPEKEAVDVFILDTAYPLKELQGYPNPVPLLTSLLSKLDVVEYPDPALMAALNDHVTGVAAAGHDYLMRDHGTFIAGVIHSIAPAASLHLLQVLNDYGVGTLETVTWGFRHVLDDVIQSKRTAVVNCSFTINLPLPTHRKPGLKWAKLDSCGTGLLYRMSRLVGILCDLLTRNNVAIVAAAGNDAFGRRSRPEARYPAAFSNVIGVGAVLKDAASVAPYSNKADIPTRAGFVTFGGNVASTGDEAVPDESVLGIYIAKDYPDGTPNSSGCAWWSGTSFSTPVISGVLAGLAAQTATLDDAQQALVNATTGVTAHGERILPMRQGA